MAAPERKQHLTHLIAANRSTPTQVLNDYVLGSYKPIIDVMARDGLTAKQAAIALAVPPPPTWVTNTSQFKRAVELERESWQQAYDITRRDVVNGILSGVDLARSVSDAASVIRGWVEIGKLCGLNAPQRLEIKAEVTHDASLRDLQRLSDEQLLQLIEQKQKQNNTIEGEVVQYDDNAKPY